MLRTLTPCVTKRLDRVPVWAWWVLVVLVDIGALVGLWWVVQALLALGVE